MAQIVKETIITKGSDTINVTPPQATDAQTTEYLIYFFFGALDILLTFRLILKLAGASVTSTFVEFIYGLSGLFVLPFEGIFRKAFTQGIETTSVLEPATIVAIAVYAVLAWGIVNLIRIFSGQQQPTE